MNAERLLALFEQISEAPDAISRLRRFILDLAVRGKLVEQDPQDEPAEEQLARIIEAKILHGRRERTTKKKRSELADESLGLPLPARWTTVPLADLVTVLNGRAYKQSELLDTGTPVLRVGNLFTSNKWYYSNLELEDDKYCDDGDLIFAWSASFGPFIWNGGRAIYHYHIWKLPLHSPEDLSRDYLYLYLLNKTGEIKASGHGISMVHMTKEKMERLEVPLPPLAEQHRIVAKVDELMALCDQLEAARMQREQCRERLVAASMQRLNQPSEDPEAFRSDARFALQVLPSLTTTPAQIKQLRQTILNLAVRGKLVEQDPEDYIESLLKTVREDQRKALANGGIKRSVLLSRLQEGWLFTIPPHWEWLPLGSLVVQGPQNGISPKETTNPGAPKALTLAATTTGKLRPDFFKAVDLRPDQALPYRLAEGDLLFQRGNTREYVGMAAIYDIQPGNFIFPDLMIRIRISDSLSLAYVHLVLTSPPLRDYFSTLATGASETMPKINQGILCDAPIPLPPLAEQHRIVAKVDELMALCDQLEQQLSQAEQSRRGLLEAVLQEALAGRLPERPEERHAAIA
jgi:type I restriction enzyme S subunit